MRTEGTGNRQSTYNLRTPLFKQSKHQAMPMVANYALMLLKVYQDNKGGYTKKELVAEALGHIDNKYVTWNDWTDAAFCGEFAAFNHNMLLEYSKDQKKWFWGNRMTEYLKHHFGNHASINLNGKPYDDAVRYNMLATTTNIAAKELYKREKWAAENIFFQ